MSLPIKKVEAGVTALEEALSVQWESNNGKIYLWARDKNR